MRSPPAKICLKSRPLDPTQYRDDTGTVMPWFTRPFLDVLQTWDISTWSIAEWGTGYSTLWFIRTCAQLTSIEHNPVWFDAVTAYLKEHQIAHSDYRLASALFKPGPERESQVDYINALDNSAKKYDCIIIDGMHRNACAKKALDHIKQGGIIILDNADQQSIGISSQPTFQLLKKYKHYSYAQPGHVDWKTDYWIISE